MPLAQKSGVELIEDCEELAIVGSDALIYRMLFNLPPAATAPLGA